MNGTVSLSEVLDTEKFGKNSRVSRDIFRGRLLISEVLINEKTNFKKDVTPFK